MKWIKRALILGVIALCTISVSIFVIKKTADGPVGPIPGARFTSGTLMGAPVDWSTIFGLNDQLELQLVGPGTSRVTGAIVHDGELYISCDLGFIWNRFPNGVARWMLHTIYLFKDWHEEALRDGRVVVRNNGILYERHLILVTDPNELSALKNAVEEGLMQVELPVDELGPLPVEGPRDIWFFRVGLPIKN